LDRWIQRLFCFSYGGQPRGNLRALSVPTLVRALLEWRFFRWKNQEKELFEKFIFAIACFFKTYYFSLCIYF
jgi:hypothetical protein